ncbi:alpha-1,6- mannanase [Schizosaccharomyces pombe]|uniref:Meiotically up-regulated gene 191 protein n=1 Tax=Schizosaccharomyces pombe (strain 972 / ATCC 24843) TaxID=284812 RepID=MU191_SCHPO|nr:putative alpha-1,6-mannanase [Schizosaccharomyces pombe]O14131.1 RecName: Full=Meiotically up-regulated gene 191 protein [Schizosaccharomyces pombe 972h-]CAB16736.1 alpha-1,6-mannanase (predicted) [Schizosaccharomyces pombe]|eukprot:NP_593606.1 putative alpha-1,6-mannanase [Schizosaccharomyces pombe]
MSENVYLNEALNVVDQCFKTFFDKYTDRMGSAFACSGTIDKDHIFLVWSVAVYAEAMADSLRYTSKFERKFEHVFQALKKYWSPVFNACCAFHYFEGNDDVYYDDNAQVAIGLATAGYYTTNSSRRDHYVSRAESIISLIINKGWNQQRGGIAWHTRTTGPPWTNLNACSTSMSAVAALRLALALDDPNKKQHLVSFAWNCVRWIQENLLDENHIVCDGLSLKDGKWVLDKARFTYNTGTTMTAMSLLMGLGEFTKGLQDIEKLPTYLEDMARGALDTNGPLYDQSCNGSFKVWSDNTFFAQHLSEGLMTFSYAMPSSALAKPAQKMVLDQADFLMKYLRIPKEGLYYRNFGLYKLSPELTASFNKFFNANKQFQPDKDERIQQEGPVEQRPLCPTLIGSAGAARMLFSAAEIVNRNNPSSGESTTLPQPSHGKKDKDCVIS